MNARAAIRGCLKGALRALLAAVLLAAGSAVLLQTRWAGDRLAAAASRRWSSADFRVTVSGAQVLWPDRLRVRELRLADTAGEWLSATGLHVRLSIPDLWARRWTIREGAAAAVHLVRRPERTGGPARASPARWPALAVDRLRADEIVLGEAVAGERIRFRARGRAQVDPQAGLWCALEAERTDGLQGSVRILARWSGDVLHMQAGLVDDPRGPLARRLPSRLTSPLRARLRGSGPSRAFAGALRAEAGGAGQLDASFMLDARAPRAVRFQWVFLNGGLLPAAYGRLEGEGSLQDVPERPAGEVSATVMRGDESFSARAAVRYGEGRLRMSDIDFRAGTLSVTGAVEFEASTRLATGRLSADLPYVSDIAGRFGWPVGGEAHLDVDLVPDGGAQRARIRGEVFQLTSPWAGAAGLRVEADLCPFGLDPTGRVEIAIEDVSTSRATLSNLVFRVEGERRGVEWSASAEWDGAGRWDGAATGAVLIVRELGGRFAGGEFGLETPARIAWGGGGYAWGPTAWRVGPGRLEVDAGTLTGGVLRASARLDGLPLVALAELGGPGLKGRVSGELALGGRMEEPEAELRLYFSGVLPREPLILPLAPADAELGVRASNGMLRAEWTLSGPATVSGDLQVPFQWSLRPWSARLPGSAPLSGRLHAGADLARLVPASFLEDRAVRGRLKADLTFGGRLDAPDIDGSFELQDGYYEDLDLGLVFQDIGIEAQSDLVRLTITQALARDGLGGRVELTGHLDYAPSRRFPYELNIRFDNAALIREDHFRLDADGEVKLAGSMAGHRLAGRLQIRELDYESVERPSASIPQLDVTEINRPGAPPGTPATNGPARPLELDLDIRAPARVYIRGRGLDSEWQGRLRVGGTLAEPVFLGSFNVLRGRFLFLGRRFALDRALISLDGRAPPDPQLDISASVEAGGITARLGLAGSWDTPAWSLTSEPALPEDEIMSRLLFNREADGITALQALRLAYGLNLLRGGGGGGTFDILGKSQNLLRVDQLDIKQDADDPSLTSIAVGKYLGERVYVEGEKSLAGEGDSILVEFELSRSLRLQTISSPQLREGLRLNWNRDY